VDVMDRCPADLESRIDQDEEQANGAAGRPLRGQVNCRQRIWSGVKGVTGPIRVEICRQADCRDVPLPRCMSDHAAGMDVCAACRSDVTIAPGEVVRIPCGFSMAVPVGYEAQIRPRSGLAARHGITIPNAPGTIDADFRGEVCVLLGNVGRTPFVLTRGMRVAQLVIAPVTRAEIVEVDGLASTGRGQGGFGHTGA